MFLLQKKLQTDENKYLPFEPELIVEALSEATKARYLVDEFIQYRKIKTLNYYLLIGPENIFSFAILK